MGVQGLWEVVNKVGQSRSLANLAVIEGFEKDPSGNAPFVLALGEAEAELAHLNRYEIIDAVLTDDVDALVFGALRVIKNSSLTFSGNKSNPALDSEGKPSKHHAMIYTAEAIRKHPEVGLTRGGFVLFAVLVKGDYGDGVRVVGKGIAHGLARCGFGD
ncbi:XPG I-region-domain-containing protein [Suillus lakei]|nr:XPG I-region-domain-containing protein [Suillus lakei]